MRKREVIGEAERGDIGHDVIGALGPEAAEAGAFQDGDDLVLALAVIVRQMRKVIAIHGERQRR